MYLIMGCLPNTRKLIIHRCCSQREKTSFLIPLPPPPPPKKKRENANRKGIKNSWGPSRSVPRSDKTGVQYKVYTICVVGLTVSESKSFVYFNTRNNNNNNKKKKTNNIFFRSDRRSQRNRQVSQNLDSKSGVLIGERFALRYCSADKVTESTHKS